MTCTDGDESYANAYCRQICWQIVIGCWWKYARGKERDETKLMAELLRCLAEAYPCLFNGSLYRTSLFDPLL